MKKVILIVACAVWLCVPTLVAAQTGNDKPKAPEQVAQDVDQDQGD